MKIPKKLVNLVDKVRKKRNEAEAQRAADLLEQDKKRKKELRRRIKNGLKYAEKIFEWVNKFSESKEGKKLIDAGSRYNHQQGIFIFTEKVLGRGSRALGVSEEGLYWIAFGCGARENYMETPEELASQIDPEILKLACETLEDGRVWKCIEEQIERRWSD